MARRAVRAAAVALVALGAAVVATRVPRAHAQLGVATGSPGCPTGFLRIPAGTFLMGSPDGVGETDEHPQHSLTVSSFCMQRLEVTVADYQACVSAGTCTAGGTAPMCNGPQIATRSNHPINCVDSMQATSYCGYIGARLPTEVEWEYAARGTDGRKYPWGNAAPSSRRLNACGDECVAYATRVHNDTKTAMYAGSDGFEETAPVGSYPTGASPFGILDMAGNVYEWTSSGYCTYPDHNCGGQYRMYRGGGWYTDKTAAAATRNGNTPTEQSVVVGIRCVSHGVAVTPGHP